VVLVGRRQDRVDAAEQRPDRHPVPALDRLGQRVEGAVEEKRSIDEQQRPGHGRSMRGTARGEDRGPPSDVVEK
jgi:hypothetical protein